MLKTALARLAKGSLIYGIGGMLQRFMGLLLLPFFTRVLTPEDYGVVALIALIGVALSGLFTLGTGSSMGVIYFGEQDTARRPSIIWSTTLLLIANSFFWYGLVLLAAPTLSELMFQTDRYASLIRLSVLGLVFSTIADPWLAYLRMEEKVKQYVVITLISSLATIGLSIWFVVVERIGVAGLILATTLANGIMLLVNWLVVARKLKLKIDIDLIGPLVHIGFPSIFGLFAFLLIDYADRQMIERMVGLDALGKYSVGYSFGLVMSVAMGAFATAWPPFFTSYINKHDEARHVFARVLTYYLLGFGGLVVLFFFFSKPVVVLMTAPVFHEAYKVVGLIAAAYMLKGCYLIMLPGIYFSRKLHMQSAIEWVAAITNIGLNIWLIPDFGIVGAAIATFISYLLLPILAWSVARVYLRVDYEWSRIIKILLSVGIASGLIYWSTSSLNDDLFITAVASSLILIGFFLFATRIILSASERDYVWSKLRC
ncbi:MAG: oligosaccharide flippase family protein [Alcaligenaceae bacterium]